MKEIQKEMLLSDTKNNAKQILEVVKNINPQFYKKKTESEIVAELNTIQYLIRDIPNNILSKMCELAIKKYPKKKIEDDNLTFNLNYIMLFYTEAKFIIDNDLTSLDDLFTDIETLEVTNEKIY